MPHQVFIARGEAAGAKRDVGNLEAGAPERRVLAHSRSRRFDRSTGGARQRQDRYAHAGQHAAFQELASSNDRSVARSFHLITSRNCEYATANSTANKLPDARSEVRRDRPCAGKASTLRPTTLRSRRRGRAPGTPTNAPA